MEPQRKMFCAGQFKPKTDVCVCASKVVQIQLFYFIAIAHQAKIIFLCVGNSCLSQVIFEGRQCEGKQESFLCVEVGVEWQIFVGEGEKRPMTQFHTQMATHTQTHTHTHTHTHTLSHTQSHLTWGDCNYGFRYLYFCLREINSKNHGINSIYFCSFYLLTCTLHSNLALQDSF